MLEYYEKRKTKTNFFNKGSKMKLVSKSKKSNILPFIKQDRKDNNEINKNIRKSMDKVVIKNNMGKTQYSFRNDSFGFK